jgi:hypothetical protein
LHLPIVALSPCRPVLYFRGGKPILAQVRITWTRKGKEERGSDLASVGAARTSELLQKRGRAYPGTEFVSQTAFKQT